MAQFIQTQNILNLHKWEGVGTPSTDAIYEAFGKENFSINVFQNLLFIHEKGDYVVKVEPGDYLFRGSLGYDFTDKKPVRVITGAEVASLFIALPAGIYEPAV
jgi:hypothetical protein